MHMMGVAMGDIVGNVHVACLDHHYYYYYYYYYYYLGGLRRRVRSLFWRVRAEIRRQVKKKNNTSASHHRRNFSFHYDPFSYALNFDNTCSAFLC
ncbi:hypothetical protein Scep_015905 [Stephania cephalantha]|uniref:Uncharacterized protein n=1 Tax=Stephania cephalantha TaxID=152367 RepID=A0AAP0INJ1_9MAGN